MSETPKQKLHYMPSPYKPGLGVIQDGKGVTIAMAVQREDAGPLVASRELLAACQRAHDFMGIPSREYREKYPDHAGSGARDKQVVEILAKAIAAAELKAVSQ